MPTVTSVTSQKGQHHRTIRNLRLRIRAGVLIVLRLDYVSCVLSVVSTILVGRRCWEGWLLAGINSVIICVIAVRTAQTGFIPANLFCIVLCGINLRTWRKEETPS